MDAILLWLLAVIGIFLSAQMIFILSQLPLLLFALIVIGLLLIVVVVIVQEIKSNERY